MFTVYNKGSVTFQSTSGNLYHLDKVDQLAESRLKPDDDRVDSFDSYTKGKKQNDSALNSYKKMANTHESDEVYHVKDIMITNYISIDQNATLQDAYDLLKENEVSQIPIVKENNEIVSMINKKIILNLLMNDIDSARDTLQRSLHYLELPEILTTAPTTDIRWVAKALIEYKRDAIPVVNKQHILLGIVSKTNIIKAIADIPHIHFFA